MTTTVLDRPGFRPLKALAVGNPPQPALAIGDRAELSLLPLDRLVVDDRYQRTIGKQGRPNVLRILAGFDWRKFTPVVVTPVGDGIYAIIDGQHRATAALMHPAIDMVPCMIIKVTPEEAAACFAAINGVVTRITPGQIWKARVRSGEAGAVALDRVLSAADVRVISYKMPGHDYAVGDTMAVGTLEKLFVRFGAEVLTTALQSVTQSGNGNPGCLCAPMLVAMCEIVAGIEEFQKTPSRLFELMDELHIEDLILNAAARGKRERRPHAMVIKEVIAKHLAQALEDAGVPA